VRVVNHADKRAVGGRGSQQAEYRQAYQEAIRSGTCAHAERDLKRLTLGAWQPAEQIEHRPAQPVQPAKGQLRLRLRARRPDHPQTGVQPGREVQQCRLSRTRLAVHHEDGAAPAAHAVNQLGQSPALSLAPVQPERFPIRRHDTRLPGAGTAAH
jgi:hypothetical protein